MVGYNVGELLVNIYTGYRTRLSCIKVSNSQFVVKLLCKLVVDGYIGGFSKINNGKQLLIYLKYYDSKPIISDIILISRPTQRIMLSCRTLHSFYRTGYLLLSTKKGILTRSEALKNKLGGLVLCQIW